MAINKLVDGSCATHSDLKACLNYVLQENKTDDTLVEVTGPFHGSITPDNVYDAFIDIKQLYNKDKGKMYQHSILSFPQDEYITPEDVLEIAVEVAETDPFYKDYQTLVVVHTNKSHLHAHLLNNSVSYIDGHKHHHNNRDLEALKQHTNAICLSRGLSVAQKGQHYDGTAIEEGQVQSYSNRDYNMNTRQHYSWKRNIYDAVIDAVNNTNSRQEFINYLENEKNIKTNWTESRKNITFEDAKGHRIRASTLSKTYNITYLATKETLSNKITSATQKKEGISLGTISPPSVGLTSMAIQQIASMQSKQKEEEERQRHTQHL